MAGDTPANVPLTSFSILLSRARGDLLTQVAGALAIPRWLTQYVGGTLDIVTVQGHDFPSDLSTFKLVVLCGGCTITQREVLGRIARCRAAGVPVTNYGITIAFSLGIFERALEPFPAAREIAQAHRRRPEDPAGADRRIHQHGHEALPTPSPAGHERSAQ